MTLPIMASPEPTFSRNDKIKLVFIVVTILFITWMVMTSTPEPPYYCSGERGQISLTAMGTCTTTPPE